MLFLNMLAIEGLVHELFNIYLEVSHDFTWCQKSEAFLNKTCFLSYWREKAEKDITMSKTNKV